MPSPESAAGPAPTLWPPDYALDSAAPSPLDATGSADEVGFGDLEPLLVTPGQLHLQFADETLIP